MTCLFCEEKIKPGEPYTVALVAGDGPVEKHINQPVHFDCFAQLIADRCAQRVTELLVKNDQQLDKIVDGIVNKFIRD